MPTYSTLSVRNTDNAAVVEVLSRRIYLKVVEEFREEINDILRNTTGALLLDLGKVSVMNSAGLGVIIATQDYMQKQQRPFLVANLQPLMQEIFNRMQLGTLITATASVNDGLLKLQESTATIAIA